MARGTAGLPSATSTRTPSPRGSHDFSERVDAALVTDGTFSRLVGLVLRSQLPTWFQPYADMEAKAAYISTYQAQVVYGLLQTEKYARAVPATGMPKDLEALGAARMERQRILEGENPPLAWAVLDGRCCTGRSAARR